MMFQKKTKWKPIVFKLEVSCRHYLQTIGLGYG